MAEVEIISPLQDHEFIDTCYELGVGTHFWFRWRIESFIKQLDRLQISRESSMRVLDVGAGTGVVREQVEAVTNWIVDITDLDHGALKASSEGRGKTYYYDVLEKRPEWKEKYDAILLFDVLEHIEKTEGFIDALLFHLKKDGFLFINVPAMPILFSRYDEVQGHFRRYTLQTLEKEFAASPVEIADMTYWGWMNIPMLLVRRVWLKYTTKGDTDEEIYRQGFSPPGKIVNDAFLQMMQLELKLPTQKIAGSSILMVGKKQSTM